MSELAGKFVGKKISPSSSEPIFLPQNLPAKINAMVFDAPQMPALSPIGA
jgi:hypothetical protein